jgi:hypothetical protein
MVVACELRFYVPAAGFYRDFFSINKYLQPLNANMAINGPNFNGFSYS